MKGKAFTSNKMEAKREMKKPAGIMFLGIFLIVAAILSIPGILINQQVFQDRLYYLNYLNLYLSIAVLINIINGIGLLRSKELFRKTTICWMILSSALCIFYMVSIFIPGMDFMYGAFRLMKESIFSWILAGSLIGMLFYVAVIWYLTRPRVKEVFAHPEHFKVNEHEFNNYGLAGLILGALGLLCSPMYGFGILPSTAGLICSIIQIRRKSSNQAIIGMILNILGLVSSIIVIAFMSLIISIFI